MRSKETHVHLSRRERQIMEVVYARGEASAEEVLAGIPSPPGYSAVRALLRILEEKGHLAHRREGRRYVYTPTVPAEQARRSILSGFLDTFFGGSVEKAVAALLDTESASLSDEEYERLSRMIDEARKEGR